MIFGGYGRKTKTKGEVFYVCTRCESLNPFVLAENYGYGQLYGVRLAKYKTNRFLLCAHCQDGYELDRAQWDNALAIAKELKARGYELSLKEMAESAVELARVSFPDLADAVRSLLAAQLGELPPGEESDDGEGMDAASPPYETKLCPDCAEEVKAAARKCRFCGYAFDPPAQPASLESPTASETTTADKST